MIQIRSARERGHADHGWLDSHHTFSFADYYEPSQMGFRSLRVINEDRVAAGRGFGSHPHRDMEILSYVLEGALAHQDSTGKQGVIRHGALQRMSAGSGVVHSEFNASKTEPVHFYQIWIQPSETGITPRYEDRDFPVAAKPNALELLASPDGAEGSLDIHQDVRFYRAVLDRGASVTHELAQGRHAWLQVASGDVAVNGEALKAGDGASVSAESALTISADSNAEILLFDLN
jgi:redox-sensitive bicupin YhaK (pirin superfamily)